MLFLYIIHYENIQFKLFDKVMFTFAIENTLRLCIIVFPSISPFNVTIETVYVTLKVQFFLLSAAIKLFSPSTILLQYYCKNATFSRTVRNYFMKAPKPCLGNKQNGNNSC